MQLLNSWYLAAVGRQRLVGYELYADIVNKTHPQYTCQLTVGQRSNKIDSITGNTY
jgi:ribosomal protein L31